ncbi:MAG: Hsp33 family molecular chaperone HslO [Eubacterium sp.]|nr:Hsp33 family molecular chaperone HslO [Eubacterium sp.]
MGKIIRALSADGSVFCAAINSRDIVNEIFRIHNTSPVASAALGRFATIASLMGCLMKSKSDRLTLRIKGDGLGGAMTAVADYLGNVKCYTGNNNVDLPLNAAGKLDVSGYVGKNGFLAVIKDLGLKEPYATQTPIVSGEIAEDIAYYYAVSEQIPTVCALGVLVDTDWSIKAAGGFLIQLIPPINDKVISIVEKNVDGMKSVTDMLSNGIEIEKIAIKGLEGLNAEILDTFTAQYHCDCSRERTMSMLISLGEKEIDDLIKKEEETEVCCHFCNKKYLFSYNEMREILYSLREEKI